MGRRKAEEMDPRAQLVREICSMSSAYAACTHRRSNPRKPTFVDWYLILRVDESAGVDLVRKRYLHLALQLHPDKNKHPQAEIAFKLVSEAHACLSDEARRRAFDSERRDSACQECTGKLHHDQKHALPNNNAEGERDSAAARHLRSRRILQALREVTYRIREDAKVIEHCLRAHRALKSESPVFDPSDCLLYPGYPHPGLSVPKDVWWLRTGDVPAYQSRRGGCESPVYEIGSDSASKSHKFRF
uniref:Chaperone protein dnaJ 49 n=1 Tax=Anthurium amnicola TaxID=1678845 RepID=A0A1D1YCG8_9ARAE